MFKRPHLEGTSVLSYLSSPAILLGNILLKVKKKSSGVDLDYRIGFSILNGILGKSRTVCLRPLKARPSAEAVVAAQTWAASAEAPAKVE